MVNVCFRENVFRPGKRFREVQYSGCFLFCLEHESTVEVPLVKDIQQNGNTRYKNVWFQIKRCFISKENGLLVLINTVKA